MDKDFMNYSIILLNLLKIYKNIKNAKTDKDT